MSIAKLRCLTTMLSKHPKGNAYESFVCNYLYHNIVQRAQDDTIIPVTQKYVNR